MATTHLTQLQLYTDELVAAAKILADYSRESRPSVEGGAVPWLVPPDAPGEVIRARRSVLSNAARLQILLAEPSDFIQRLASQPSSINPVTQVTPGKRADLLLTTLGDTRAPIDGLQTQLLACLQWLGEFQVLACVPLSGSAPITDVADLAGVPASQLARIARMTATAGFLQEPQPGCLAHTALSAPFVTKLSYLDAALFLAETAAPSALQMAAATQRQVHPGGPHQHPHRPNGDNHHTAFRLAFNTEQTFKAACEQRAKLQRQWPCYLRCAGDMDDTVAELLRRLDWHSLGNACIVDVDANSTATASALAELYPALHFVVQMGEPAALQQQASTRDLSPRISVQSRVSGSLQTVKDAAVYILGLRAPISPASQGGLAGAQSSSSSSSSSASCAVGSSSADNLSLRILTELRAHLGVLRSNTSAMLVLAPRLLPEPGSVDPDVEAMARVRDLSLLQLANEREMEMGELVEIVESLRDSMGRLVVVNKLRSRNSASVALGIKYQAFADHETEPILL